MANRNLEFYIGGRWVAPASSATLEVIDPATEAPFTRIAAANAEDVDRAVAAARAAFDSYSRSSREERIALLTRILEGFNRRKEDLARAMAQEMGVPITAARNIHFPSGPAHLAETIKVLKDFPFDLPRGSTMVTREPIGVCGMITPWNFPINQVACKVVPALAATQKGRQPAARSAATAARRAGTSKVKSGRAGRTRTAAAPSPRSSAAFRMQLCPSLDM